MSLDNATRCCRSILPNERVPLISEDDLLAGELKKCDLPSGFYYRMPMLMGGSAPLVLSLGTLRVLYCATRCETSFNGKEKKTTSILAVFEGEMLTERLQKLGSLEGKMQMLLGNGVADFLSKNQVSDSRMASVNKKLCLLDRSRVEEGTLNRLPTIALEINETQANLKPTIAHMNREKRAFRTLDGTLTDHLKSLEYTHNGPSGDEIRYRPFLLQGACVQINHCTVTAQYKASVKLILREATINLDTLGASSNANANANPSPLLPPCDMAVSVLECDVVLGRPIEMSEETMAMGWKDGIWKRPAAPLIHYPDHLDEYQRLFGRMEYTNAFFNLTKTSACHDKAPAFTIYNPDDITLREDLFMTDFGDDRKRKGGASESVSTRFKVRLAENGRMKRIVLRTFDSSIGFVSDVKQYGEDNLAVQASVSVDSDMPIISTLNTNIKALITHVLQDKKLVFKGPKGAAYHKKMVEAVEHFSLHSVKYNSIKVELAQRPGTRAFATTRTRVDDRLIPVVEFAEGLIRPVRFKATGSELEGVSYSSVSESWTCQISCKEVIAPSEVHSSGLASILMPIWFDEDDAEADHVMQAVVAENVVAAAIQEEVATTLTTIEEDVLLTQKRVRKADDTESCSITSKKSKK